MPFITQLRVEYVDGTTARLLEDLVYKGKWDELTVPVGYETDFASVPWWVQSLLPRTGPWTKAAVVHDILCHELFLYDQARRDFRSGKISAEQFAALWPHAPIPSCEADGIFRRIMREQGVDPIRRWLMWAGVRWGAISRARREGWWAPSQAIPTILITLAALVAILGSWSAVHLLVDWIIPW